MCTQARLDILPLPIPIAHTLKKQTRLLNESETLYRAQMPSVVGAYMPMLPVASLSVGSGGRTDVQCTHPTLS